MALTKEVFDSLPESVQSDYELSGDEYVTKDSLKTSALKASLNNLDSKLKATEKEKADQEAAKAAEITAGIDAALAEAVASGDTKAQLKLEREKLDDERKRLDGDKEGLLSQRKSMAKDKEKNVINKLSLKVTDRWRPTFKRLMKDYVRVDPETMLVTFLNDDGSASSLNEESFYSEFLLKSEDLKPMLKGYVPTVGAGLANGSTDGGASRKDPKKMTEKEKLQWKNEDPLGFKQHYKLK